MEEFSQAQAALLTGYDERTFRSLVDKRVIIPSPETRNFGRGKAKMFMRNELRVVSVFKNLDHGLNPFQQAGITDWLRSELPAIIRQVREEYPIYAIVEPDHEGGWRGQFCHAGGQNNDKISIIAQYGEKKPLSRFFAVNILDALFWDDDEIIAGIIYEEGEA